MAPRTPAAARLTTVSKHPYYPLADPELRPFRLEPQELARERALMRRISARWGALIREVLSRSSIPEPFLAALIASESGGDPQAQRFEPAAYRRLKALVEGGAAAWGRLSKASLEAEVGETLGHRSPEYHELRLNGRYQLRYGAALREMTDELLRACATSWGLTQIMGYHQVGRDGTPWDLLDPKTNLARAVELLAEFAEAYQLDLRSEFSALLASWNTGRPNGVTFDPQYIPRTLARLKIYETGGAFAA